ncbi:hypothetical protein DFP73DRAFT_588804 [Morchella snyderi]|nr:hypothetical protein DFP73DRAFT_588804 [Morchella snyderi]
MALGTDTAALLRYGIDALLQLMGSAPYALLGPNERKSALHYLTVTAEAAARLAEVAHVDALTAQHAVLPGPGRGGGTEALTTTEQTATVGSGGGEEMLAQTLGAGVEKSKSEKQMVETETLVLGVDTCAEEIERLVGEKERVEAEVERLKGEVDRWRISRSIAEEQSESINKEVAETGEKLKAMRTGRWKVTEIESLIQSVSSLGRSNWVLQMEENSKQIAESEVSAKLEKSVQETAELQVELERARTSMKSLRNLRDTVSSDLMKACVKLKEGVNGPGTEVNSMINYLYTLGSNDGGVVMERDSAKNEVGRLCEDLERSALEAKRLREEVNRLNSEKSKIEGDMK